MAAAFGVVLLLLALSLMGVYFWLTRQQDRFSVVTGKSFRPRQLKLGRWKYPAFSFVMIVIACYAMPMLILVWASLVKVYQAPSFEALSQVSLQSYFRTLANPQVQQSAANTLTLMVIAPTLAVFIAFCASWFSVKRKMRWVEVFAITPMGVPNVVLALALFLIYVMTPIHGSIWVLIIAHIIAHLPFTTRVLSAALLQLHKELEEAAHVTGDDHGTNLAHRYRTSDFTGGGEWLAIGFFRNVARFYLCNFSNDGSKHGIALGDVGLWNVPDISGTAALGTVYMCGFVFVTIAARYVDQRQRKKAGWEMG